jgi:predicted transcriptional regulator YdeE
MSQKPYLSCVYQSIAQLCIVSLVVLGFTLLGCGSSRERTQVDRNLSEKEDKHTMEPSILHVDEFVLMGTATRIKMGSESTEEFGTIWKNFELWHEQIKSHSTDQCYYGASFGTEQQGFIEYVAGVAVENVENSPEGLVLRKIPEGQFAVFSCPVQAIGETYRHIFGEWLTTSGFQLDGSVPSFEKYPPAGDTMSPVLIHIPIRRGQGE